MKLGRDYVAKVTASFAMAEALEKNMIRINFGAQKFRFPLPSGYSPYQDDIP